MPTNQLMPFANGDTANVIDFTTWNTLPQRISGFGSGIARSDWFNRILAQGGAAGYVLGQFVVEYMSQDATIDAEDLYSKFKLAIAEYVPGNIADGSIATEKLSQRATKKDIENGTAMRVVCADVVKQYFDVVCPPGMIGFFHATDVPEGWLLCNGAAVSRTTYARLFAKIGVKYGSGNGSTTFNLPNLDGRVLQGTTNTGSVGTYLEAQLPNISGGFVGRPNELNAIGSFGGGTGAFRSSIKGGTSGAQTLSINETTQIEDQMTFQASFSSSLYKANSTVQQKAMQLLPCIRI